MGAIAACAGGAAAVIFGRNNYGSVLGGQDTYPMQHLFCDMDGVLADFDSHHENIFGHRPRKDSKTTGLQDVNWGKVRRTKDFYLHIPPMRDMHILWNHISRYDPTLLTGVPDGVPEARENKLAWVRKHLGNHVKVITCRSREKSLHMKNPGDILIDDWEKYKDLWIKRGGVWITHKNAIKTIHDLEQHGFR